MPDDIISIKGIAEGLLITLNPQEKWERITTDLAARLDEKAAFFAGARVTIDAGERPVPRYELSSLRALLERRTMTLAMVVSDSSTTLASATALDIRTRSGRKTADPDLDDVMPISPEEQGTGGVMIRRTLRSGRIVHSRGHVVVYGDVNPGAKIVAVGDVIVWGRLRGMVHAGAEGDKSAVVCALDMSPGQLRIADFITTSPPDKKRSVHPEIASVRDEQIVVEAWG
ncbi:MAG: septum site-determining protein MinC [Anaerolineae bacterium]|jgi:septum site-determining protein MinC|nr:septum site-determining protein MinC [Anaerolineae bacterium]